MRILVMRVRVNAFIRCVFANINLKKNKKEKQQISAVLKKAYATFICVVSDRATEECTYGKIS